MTLKSTIQTFKLLLLVLSFSALTACASNEEAKPDTMTGGSLVGINYTNNGIQQFSVDEAGGGRIGRYGISGRYCCAMYPRVWTPELKVTVEWERSDGREKDGKTWKLKSVKKTISIEKYTELGEVYVAFLPKDEVRVYVWHGVINGPSYPGNLGEPTDPNETRNKAP